MNKGIIGENAGIVWRLLNNDNRWWEFSEIERATGMDDKELSAAIGWLAREDKIQIELDKNQGKVYLSLILNVYIG